MNSENPNSGDSQIARDLFERAVTSLLLGMPDKALLEYEKILADEPQNIRALCGKAQVRYMQGHEKEALEELDKVIAREPSSWWGYLAKGELLLNAQRLSEAANLFEEAKTHADRKDAKAYCDVMISSAKEDHVGVLTAYRNMRELGMNNPQATIYAAISQLELGDTENACENGESVIKLAPKSHPGFLLRGLGRLEKKEYQGAYDDFSNAIRLAALNTTKEQLSEWHCLRSLASEGLQNYPAALGDLSRSVKLNPKNGKTYFFLGRTKGVVGDLEGAIQAYTHSLNQKYDRKLCLNTRGRTYLIMEKKGDAKRDFKELQEIDPDGVEGIVGLGACAREEGKFEEAHEYYAEAIRKKPNSAEAYLGLASLADAEGKPDESKMYEEKASSLEPENQAVLLMIALRDFRNDKYQEAKSKLDQADAISSVPMVVGMRAYMASFSEDPEAAEYIKIAMAYPGTQAMGLFGSAVLCAKKSDFREAERLLSIAIGHSQENSMLLLFYSMRAELRIEMEAFRTALKDIDKALELKPKDEDLHVSRGNVLVRMKRYTEGLKDANIALEINSGCASAHSLLGQVDYEQKKAGLGLSHFEKALAINSKFGEGYYFIGLIRMKSDDRVGAAEMFEKAAELGIPKAGEQLELMSLEHAEWLKPRGVSHKDRVRYLLENDFKDSIKDKETINGVIRNRILNALKQKYGIIMTDHTLRAYLQQLDYVKMRGRKKDSGVNS